MIDVLIVDDEPMARERLRRLVGEESDLRIVGESAGGVEALAAIRASRPAVVFLDVDMPDLGGFDVLEALEPDERPLVVFVTAYDEFAVRAFDVHALDYLLKPYDPARFATAVARVRERLAASRGRAGESAERLDALEALLAEVRERAAGPRGDHGPERLVVRSGAHSLFIPVRDIDWIEAADNYVEVHVGAKSHLVRETLASVERRLSPARFTRIRRDAIVNLDRVHSVRSTDDGESDVVLHDGRTLRLGRSYRAKLTERWQGSGS